MSCDAEILYKNKRYRYRVRADDDHTFRCDRCCFLHRKHCGLPEGAFECGRHGYFVELDDLGNDIDVNTISNYRGEATKIEFGESYTVIFAGESDRIGDIRIQMGMTMPNQASECITQHGILLPYSTTVYFDTKKPSERWNIVEVLLDYEFLRQVHVGVLPYYRPERKD